MTGGKKMTVESQVSQALASAKSLEAQMMTFASQTENQQAKQMYQNMSQVMCDVCQQLEQRHQEIMMEEPQYNKNQQNPDQNQ
jgi:hypothetical protein